LSFGRGAINAAAFVGPKIYPDSHGALIGIRVEFLFFRHLLSLLLIVGDGLSMLPLYAVAGNTRKNYVIFWRNEIGASATH